MSKIKIFVSHRIGLESNIIKNPLYKNVLCGAVFNKNKTNFIGDNTGDNISEKRETYNEFTVQYWAWKNCDADYYGLCHYRRYLSFADEVFTGNEFEFAVEDTINKNSIKKYNLNKYLKMKLEIEKYDVITALPYDVSNIYLIPTAKTEYELWINHPRCPIPEYIFNLVKIIIKERHLTYYNTFLELLELDQHRGFNCFVMKKKFFFEMCEFQFDVLSELENCINLEQYEGSTKRVPGYLSEVLNSTYILWLQKQNKCKIKENQIIFFENTEKLEYENPIKRIAKKVLPGYRVALRSEKSGQLGQKVQYNEILALRQDVRRLIGAFHNLTEIQRNNIWFSNPKHLSDQEKKVFWDEYPLAEGKLRLVQRSNMILLERMKKMCDELNIKFWLHGGSLVGALRHKGYVPWDDDIDVAMMRDDFNILNKFIENNKKYNIVEYYYGNLSCRSYRLKRVDIDSNCFVDIFIYDNCKVEEYISDMWKQLKFLKGGLKNQYKVLTDKYNHIPLNEDMQKEKRLEQKAAIDKLINIYITRTKSSTETNWISWGIENNYEGPGCYAWENGRIFTRDEIFPLRTCIFEGSEQYIPSDFEKYVLSEYGIGYLEMPSNLGQTLHLKQYFPGDKEYEELVEFLEKEEQGI